MPLLLQATGQDTQMPITITDNNGITIAATHIGFSGGERHVQLANPTSAAAPTHLTLRAFLRGSDDIFDLLLTRNAIQEAFGDVAMDIEIPYLPYARQDRVCAPGQAFSLKVLADALSTASKTHRLAVWDCHSSVGIALTGATNVEASNIVLAHPELRALIEHENTVLVCPDKGARARCENMAKALGDRPLVYCEKVRDPATGKILGTDVHAQTLEGKTAVITDDICDGGMTFIKIAEQLKAKRADKVVLFVTHGIFSKGLDVFDGLIDHIYTTNSFPRIADRRLTCINYEYNFNEGR
jgi:ribose-phosphate pyrophosphokinase